MRRRFLFLIVAGLAGVRQAAGAEPPRPPAGPAATATSCVDCHAQLDGELLEPTKHAQEDIHFLKGLSCHDCHGGNPAAGFDGDPTTAHDRAKGWTGRPPRSKIPEFCAKCHADASFMKRFDPHARVDQLSEYRTSVHGKKRAQGDERVAVCVDCHGVHGIRAVGDPRSKVYPTNVAETCGRCHASDEIMGHYFIPTGQLGDYRRSVHARALYEKGDTSAPTCNDCHGSHGAVPPGVENIASVCGSCHGREATLFLETEAKRKLDLTACIQCMVCHSNHAVMPPTDPMLGVGPDSTCTGCHTDGEPGYKAAARMAASLAALSSRLEEARALLDRAEQAGMEVGPDRYALQKGRDDLVEAKVLIHSFDLDRFLAATDEGSKVASAGVVAGRQAFAELRYRRAGLALSLVVIAALIVVLGLKIREMERARPE
jgi:cytochrome c554/c'-like protein